MTFTGRVPDDVVAEVLSTADLGLSPDPLNPLNDVSTMNKTMEYMAFELPVVAFDLKETRVSADDAAVYVEPNDVAAYARAISEFSTTPNAAAHGSAGQAARPRRARLAASGTPLRSSLRTTFRASPE